MLQLADQYLFSFGGALLFFLGALAFGDVQHGSDPAGDCSVVVLFRRVDHMQESRSDTPVMDFPLKFDPVTLQDFLDVWANCLKVFIAQNVRQSFTNNLFGSTAGHLQIRVADEAIAKIPIQPDEHEWRPVNNALELGFLVAQRSLVLPQFFSKLFETVNVTGSQQQQAAD